MDRHKQMEEKRLVVISFVFCCFVVLAPMAKEHRNERAGGRMRTQVEVRVTEEGSGDKK